MAIPMNYKASLEYLEAMKDGEGGVIIGEGFELSVMVNGIVFRERIFTPDFVLEKFKGKKELLSTLQVGEMLIKMGETICNQPDIKPDLYIGGIKLSHEKVNE